MILIKGAGPMGENILLITFWMLTFLWGIPSLLCFAVVLLMGLPELMFRDFGKSVKIEMKFFDGWADEWMSTGSNQGLQAPFVDPNVAIYGRESAMNLCNGKAIARYRVRQIDDIVIG